MSFLTYTDDQYRTPPGTVSWFARHFPSLTFYSRFVSIVFRAGIKAKRSLYDGRQWSQSSLEVFRALEQVGVQFEISGLRHIEQLHTPFVLVSNHMSTLETTVLPMVIQPIRNVTFVVKASLLTYPIFKHIMRSCDPVAVGQTSPREDLKTMLKEGAARLQRGISMIVFPQGSRDSSFVAEEFNTIGIKLAHKAKVPIVPLALATDAWGNGKLIKEFGKINPAKKVRFAFGEPMWVEGRGADQHQATIQFISKHLQIWENESNLANQDAAECFSAKCS